MGDDIAFGETKTAALLDPGVRQTLLTEFPTSMRIRKLTVRVRATDSETQVVAGAYSELAGYTVEADACYAKANVAFITKIDDLFK